MIKNTAGGVYLAAYDTTASPVAGKTGDAANITGFWSKDGGAETTGFTTAHPTEIGGGTYWQPLTAAETNGDKLALRWASSTSGIVIDPMFFDTTAINYIRTGTAQSGGNATNIKLDASASSTSDIYKGLLVRILGGTGVDQVRCITNYNGSSKFATVDRNWVTAPDNTSIFGLIPADAPSLNANLQVQSGASQATIRTGTAQSGSTSNTIKLDSAASSTNNLYNNNLVQITGGTGLGQSRTIVSYNGTTKVATVDRDWITTPDATTTFSIVADTTSSIFSNQGVAQAATSSTITLASTASSVNSIYNGSLITILSGTDAGDTAEITGYVGSTKVATVSPNWASTPDTTSAYAVIPLSQSSTSSGTDTPGVTTLLARIASHLAITAAGGVTLGDDVAHGGTPGSSNATFAMQMINVTNPDGDAFSIMSPNNQALVISGNSRGIIVYANDTAVGIDGDVGIEVTYNTGGGTAGHTGGLWIKDYAKYSVNPLGQAVFIRSNAASAVDILASGSGKKALLLAGDAATDSLAIAAGAGSPVNIFTEAGGVTLGDGVAHGGTPGSSNATFAMQMINVTNPDGDAFLVRSTGGGGRGFVALGDSGGAGMFTQGGNTAVGFNVRGGSTSGAAMFLQALGGGAGLVVNASANSGIVVYGDTDFAAVIITSFGTGAGIAIDAQDTGAGISIQSSGGHAISALASGSGNKAILLAGDAATDALSIAAGAGSPIDILNDNGKILINLDAAELAKLLTMDSTKAWNDVVAGSIAKLIADNVKIYLTGLGI